LTESIVVVSSWSADVGKNRFSGQREIEIRTIADESKPVLAKRKKLLTQYLGHVQCEN